MARRCRCAAGPPAPRPRPRAAGRRTRSATGRADRRGRAASGRARRGATATASAAQASSGAGTAEGVPARRGSARAATSYPTTTPRASLEWMRRGLATRRLPLAVLGALTGLLVAVAVPSGAPAATFGSAHAAVGSGHVSDALQAAAHVRTVTHLPAALPTGPPAVSDRLLRLSVPATSPTPPAFTATSPTAIRGPPA